MLYKYQPKYHPEGKPHGRDIFLPDLNAHGVADWQDIRLPLGERKELGTKNKKTEDKKPESAELSLSIDNALLNETTLSTYRTNTVGLRSDGTVVAAGSNEDGECDVSGWRDIVAISAGSQNTVGLKSDGTVVAVGSNENNRSDVTGWRDIRLPVTDSDTDNDIIEAGTL